MPRVVDPLSSVLLSSVRSKLGCGRAPRQDVRTPRRHLYLPRPIATCTQLTALLLDFVHRRSGDTTLDFSSCKNARVRRTYSKPSLQSSSAVFKSAMQRARYVLVCPLMSAHLVDFNSFSVSAKTNKYSKIDKKPIRQLVSGQ